MKDKDMITVVYEAQARQDGHKGWLPIAAVPPKPALAGAKHEGLYHTRDWPKVEVRVVKRTTEVVWVQE